MRHLRRHRRAVLLPAIAWLAMQIAMAGGLAVAAPVGVERGASTIWICTGVGLRLIALDGSAPDATAAADPATACYWCQAFAAAASPAAPVLAALPHIVDHRSGAFALAAPDKVLALRAAGFQSRAPPLDPVA